MDKRYIHRDGQIVYASISVCCVRRTDGIPDHFVLTVQDVTPRYQVQEKLHLTEAHLKHAQQVAQIASYEAYPPDFFSTAWSQQLCDIFGVKPGTLIASREEYIERFVHPDDRDYMRQAFQDRGKADQRSMLEYRIVRPDGTVRHLQTIADPVKDQSGRIVQLVGTILDVTERELATERLETQTALLDQLFQSVAEATVLLHLDDRVLRVNTEFTRMFGYTPEQAVGLPINDLIVPAERIAEAAQLSSNLATGQMCNAESVRRREDGSRLQVSILGAPIVSGGRQIASYAIYRDISERKRVEEAHARHARHVALRADVHAAFSRAADPLQEVPRRGAEAIVQNLHGALARIWTLDQGMAVLDLRAGAGLYTHLDGPYSRIPLGHLIVGKIAQDRAPHLTNDVLNDLRIGDRDWAQKEAMVAFVGIITNASTCLRMLAADSPNVEVARETVRRTLRDGNRASEVVTRLRALFSKKDAVIDAVDLNEAAREVIAMSSSQLQRSQVILRSELADDLPSVTGDRVQLQQVILNLLMNAADAMSGVDDRPRQLVIRTQGDEGKRVRLSVQDVGVGFDSQGVDKLFEPFYTTKRDGMGSAYPSVARLSRAIMAVCGRRPMMVPGPRFRFPFLALRNKALARLR